MAFPGTLQSSAPLSEGWAVLQLMLFSMGLINHPFFRLFIVCLMESCQAVFLDNVEDNWLSNTMCFNFFFNRKWFLVFYRAKKMHLRLGALAVFGMYSDRKTQYVTANFAPQKFGVCKCKMGFCFFPVGTACTHRPGPVTFKWKLISLSLCFI